MFLLDNQEQRNGQLTEEQSPESWETSHPWLPGGEALNMDQLALGKTHKCEVITCKPSLLCPPDSPQPLRAHQPSPRTLVTFAVILTTAHRPL